MNYSRKLKAPKYWRERMVLGDYEKVIAENIRKDNEITRLKMNQQTLLEANSKLKNRINNIIQTYQEPQQTLGQWFDNGFGGLMHAERGI